MLSAKIFKFCHAERRRAGSKAGSKHPTNLSFATAASGNFNDEAHPEFLKMKEPRGETAPAAGRPPLLTCQRAPR